MRDMSKIIIITSLIIIVIITNILKGYMGRHSCDIILNNSKKVMLLSGPISVYHQDHNAMQSSGSSKTETMVMQQCITVMLDKFSTYLGK